MTVTHTHRALHGFVSSVAAFCLSIVASQAQLQPDTLKVALPNPKTVPQDYGRRFYGTATAVSGSIVVVGASWENNGATRSGSVYVYDLASAAPAVPLLSLANPTPAEDDRFGYAVAITGSKLVVGAPRAGDSATNAGMVYVYDLASETPSTPVRVLSGTLGGGFFGGSVAMSGSRVVVGHQDISMLKNIGEVHVFDLADPASDIRLDNPGAGNRFGWTVGISGSRVVVSAPEANDGESQAGMAYVYELTGADLSTPLNPAFTLRDPSPVSAGHFGSAVAIDGPRIAVGCSRSGSDSVYWFDLESGTPTAALTISNPSLGTDEWFGFSVAISGSRLAVGSPEDDTGASSGGIAYAYDLSGATPATPVSTLRHPALAGDSMGVSIAIDGTTVAAGAPQVNSPTPAHGSVFVFAPDATFAQPPTLTAPATNTVSGAIVDVSFSLPETALPGSVKLTFTGTTTVTLALANMQASSGVHEFFFDASQPAPQPYIASGEAIPDGVYAVTLSYQDAQGNSASAASSNVTVDTTAPAISGSFSPLIVEEGTLPDYLSQAVVVEANEIVEFTQSPAPGTVTTPGLLGIILKARDAAGNEGSIGLGIDVRPTTPLTDSLFVQGNAVPGAGTPDGPPADAKLHGVGLPAIDDEGHVAFTATWLSGDGKGNGIFVDHQLIAEAGGSVPGFEEGTFKSFSDPVIDNGSVVFLASIGGVPGKQSRVVMSNTTGSLQVIAQTGTAAPGTDGATFKALNTVALVNNSLAVYAQLGGKVSGANDVGVWAKVGSGPLALILREGQEVAPGKVIKKLTTFVSGNGSPGQGRGWLYEQNGTTEVCALASFVDKSQAIVVVSLADIEHPILRSQTDLVNGSGSPILAETSFASFGYPASTDGSFGSFLGTLTAGQGGVTKSNARGIFHDLLRSGKFHPVVRVGDPAIEPGSKFATLKDPIMAIDGSIAFPATITGAGIKGANAQTLWWQTDGGPITLVAQGGQGAVPVAGIPDAQWKSFPSLAVTPRGPIFVGSLVPGKGGVTKATSNGLWSVDFKGDLRLLIQSRVTQVDGKTIKTFDVLKTSVGSQGSSRSVNNEAVVVWRATFTDKTQAIVRTEVP